MSRIARLFTALFFHNWRMGTIYPTQGRGDWLLLLSNPPWGDNPRSKGRNDERSPAQRA